MGRSDTSGPESLSGMRDWVSFAEIKSQVKLAEVMHSYGVDWLRRSGPPRNIEGVAQFMGGKVRRPSTRIWGGTCFTVLPAAPAAMCWTSWWRWKAARCGKQLYGSKGHMARASAPPKCRLVDPGERNWLRKNDSSEEFVGKVRFGQFAK